MNLKYAIYPPKMAGNQVYYKDIIVLCIEDDKVIGARQYDYDGNAKIISYLDLIYNPNLNTEYDFLKKDFDTSRLLNSAVRTTWTFSTEIEAFITKLWCLKSLRDHFDFIEKENRLIFDNRIPSEINTAFSKVKENNPEYFL